MLLTHCRAILHGYAWRIILTFTLLGGVLAGLSSPAAVHAAEPAGLRNVTLSVNPEYDDPLQIGGDGASTLLVMLEGEIVGATAPVTIRFLVPLDATLYSAGSGPRASYIPPTPLPDRKPSEIPGYDEVSYELKTQFFVVEYYTPLSTGLQDRNISFDFYTRYSVTNMRAVVQEPRRATGFTVTPPGAPSQDAEGFNVRTFGFPSLSPSTAGSPAIHFDIAYNKKDNRPSLGTSGGGSGGSANPGLVLLVLLGLAIAAVLFFVIKGMMKKSPARPLPSRGSTARLNQPAAGRGAPGGGSGSRFCGQCGQPIERAAQFCPYCGAKQSSQ
jgi:hypothetical protein